MPLPIHRDRIEPLPGREVRPMVRLEQAIEVGRHVLQGILRPAHSVEAGAHGLKAGLGILTPEDRAKLVEYRANTEL